MQELKKACSEVNISYTSLKNPNETRWNSGVTNLSSIIKLERALTWLVNTDTSGQWSSIVFSPGEWRLAKAAVNVLQIPLRVTKMWEGEKYPTMNLVVSELYDMKSRLKDFASSQCNFTSQFAQVLMSKIENRFPNCSAFNDIHAIGNYIDPAFKGVHLETLGVMESTKEKILERWNYLEVDESGGTVNQGEALEDTEVAEHTREASEEDPTLKLIRARKKSGVGEAQPGRTSQLRKEMEFYEADVGMEDIEPGGDRLDWWKKHEKMLPMLSKVAKQILGIPCSSAKSERVFSTGGIMVSKKRHRLGSKRVENLLVIKENRKLVEEFKQRTGWNLELRSGSDVFGEVVLETDDRLVEALPISAIFNDDEELAVEELSSDDDFEVVFESF